MNGHGELTGQIVDVIQGRIFPGRVRFNAGRITAVEEAEGITKTGVILPGLIDSHVHIESSLLVPSRFAQAATLHGVTAAVADPHEIANVLGMEGIRFMIEDGRQVPFKFYFAAPSSVPATPYETAAGKIGPGDIEELFRRGEAGCLGEVMNFPGVIKGETEIWEKIRIAGRYGKPIDGHAPGVVGEDLIRYLAAGITTDHECLSFAEAEEKIARGMNIQIRDGSAARDLEKFVGLLDRYPRAVMLASDDLHPHDLSRGYLNETCRRAIALGVEPLKVIRAATYNPARHYGLEAGLLQVGDEADLIVIDSFEEFRVLKTYLRGEVVSADGRSFIKPVPVERKNRFVPSPMAAADFAVRKRGERAYVIGAKDGELFTHRLLVDLRGQGDYVEARPGEDLLKIAVVNRYHPAPPAVGLVKGFGLQKGAIASSVAHDSHNVIAVGATDQDLARAVNLVMTNGGGLAAVGGDHCLILPLPVAGIMTVDDPWVTAEKEAQLDSLARELGSELAAPFVTMSFMALPVIPQLKLSDRGLFDVEKMGFIDLFAP